MAKRRDGVESGLAGSVRDERGRGHTGGRAWRRLGGKPERPANGQRHGGTSGDFPAPCSVPAEADSAAGAGRHARAPTERAPVHLSRCPRAVVAVAQTLVKGRLATAPACAPRPPPFPADDAAAGQAHHASNTQSPTLGGWKAGRGPPKASPAHPHSKPKASQARQDASLPAPGTVRDASHGTAGHACAFASLDRRHTAPIAGPTCWHSRTLAPQWRGRHPARWPASPKASGLLHRESGLVGGGARTPGRDKRRGSRTGRGPSERASRRVGKGAPRREPSGSGESDEREDCLIKRADRLGPSSSATSSRAAKASRHR